MKKISTVATKQSKNFREQKLTIGLDLGDRSSWYCVLDEGGEVLLEQKLGTTPKAMKEVFGGMARSRMALETGTHSPWVSRVLSELGHEVIVAHARNVRLIGESRRKDDRMDGRTLAWLARIDPRLLAPVQHRSSCLVFPLASGCFRPDFLLEIRIRRRNATRWKARLVSCPATRVLARMLPCWKNISELIAG